MTPTTTMTDAECEIATIRCLVAQQIHVIDRYDRSGPERRVADTLLRQLLRRDEDLRRRLLEAGVGTAIPAR